MPYYHECPECGLHLDPGETCDCRKKTAPGDGTPKAACLARTKSFFEKNISLTKKNVKLKRIIVFSAYISK